MTDAATIENNRLSRLGQARKEVELAKDVAKAAVGGPGAKAKLVLSFGKKVSEHWLILAVAVIFDILALIPFLSVVFNFIFGLILFLYFGSKGKTAGSELVKIALPIGIGSVIDSVFSILPVNIGAALIRIALS
jgi:hypothetical protein